MKIKFITTHKVQQGDGKGPVYEKDSEHDFKGPVAETYARKYIARGYAVEVAADAKPEGKGGRGGRGGIRPYNEDPQPGPEHAVAETLPVEPVEARREPAEEKPLL